MYTGIALSAVYSTPQFFNYQQTGTCGRILYSTATVCVHTMEELLINGAVKGGEMY